METVAFDSITIGTSIMLVSGIFIFIFAPLLISLFTDSSAVIDVGTGYLRVEAFVLPAYVISFVAGAVLQGMKQPIIPLYFNIVRQLLLPLSFITIALHIIGTDIFGIWWSIAIATWVTAIVQFLHMHHKIKQHNCL
jgi:Na+-driven multidrug efflux pump